MKEIKEKEEVMKNLEKGVAEADEQLLKANLQKADQVRPLPGYEFTLLVLGLNN